MAQMKQYPACLDLTQTATLVANTVSFPECSMNSGSVACNNSSAILNDTWWLPFSPFKQPVLCRPEDFIVNKTDKNLLGWQATSALSRRQMFQKCSLSTSSRNDITPWWWRQTDFQTGSSFWVLMAEHQRKFHHHDVILQKALAW
jgi:hypothetical protein